MASERSKPRSLEDDDLLERYTKKLKTVMGDSMMKQGLAAMEGVVMDAEVQGAPVEGQERLRETINQFVSGLPVEEKDRETWMSTITQDLEMNTVHNRLRETLDQLVSRLKGQQEFTEILNQLVDGFNQLMSTTNQPQHHLGTSSEAKDDEYASDFFSLADVLPHREMDNGIKDDDDVYATVYFCPASDGWWYAIPESLRTPEQGDVLDPFFKEPSYPMHSSVLPFTLGPYLVLIIRLPQENSNPYEQVRDVYYIDVKESLSIWWTKAPTFIGSEMCLFFVANYKLYGLECGKDNKISLKFLDFHCMEKEWQSKSPKGYISPDLFSENFVAFNLQCEEDSNNSSQVPVRAFIYTHSRCICYDFTLNALSLSKEVFRGGLLDVQFSRSKGVLVGSTMYILVDVLRYYRLMAYSPHHDDANSCLTQVTGLEKGGVFPSSSPYDIFPLRRPTLLHLGKSRLCIIWCRLTPRRTTEVHCTKFDLYENQGKHFAKIVSTEMYNVFADYDFGYRSLDAMTMANTESSSVGFPSERVRFSGEEEFTEISNQFNELMSTKDLVTSVARESSYFSLADVLPHRERDNNNDDEYATVYFCPHSDGCWYAIPPLPRGVKRKWDALAPVFKEPCYPIPPPDFSYILTFTLGSYLVIIISHPPYLERRRDVYYIDVTKRGPNIWWVKAPTFIGSVMCFFFVANYKLYGLECDKDSKLSLKFLDFHLLEQGWQSISPQGYISPDLFSKNVVAFMHQCEVVEEEDSNTSSQVQTLRDKAFIFTDGPCIYYDSTSDALSLSKEVFSNTLNCDYNRCKGVFVGNTMYILVHTERYYSLMAYNPRHADTNSCLTQVTGLEKHNIFPSCSDDIEIPHSPATLLHLGKSRLCILWGHLTNRVTTLILCTKFDVNENQGKHFAENVSTKVYNVFASGTWRMDALACCSKTTAF